MTFASPHTEAAPISRDETGRLFGQTMGLVALTAALFALGAYLGRNMPAAYAARHAPAAQRPGRHSLLRMG